MAKIPILLIHINNGDTGDLSPEEFRFRKWESPLPLLKALTRTLDKLEREIVLMPMDGETWRHLEAARLPHHVTPLALNSYLPWEKAMNVGVAGLCYWDGMSLKAKQFRDFAARRRFPLRLFFSNALLELVYFGKLKEEG